jgi:hypothetical protein
MSSDWQNLEKRLKRRGPNLPKPMLFVLKFCALAACIGGAISITSAVDLAVRRDTAAKVPQASPPNMVPVLKDSVAH